MIIIRFKELLMVLEISTLYTYNNYSITIEGIIRVNECRIE